MRPLMVVRAPDIESAARLAGGADQALDTPAQYLAGGTVLIDLMKLDVMRPVRLIDINDLAASYGGIAMDGDALSLGALARMADVAANDRIRRDYPMLAEALWQAASPQLRNMASLAGTVLQKTRCTYFRDVTWRECNKRKPGSGCAALSGVNRRHAVLGTSPHCIATYPGDFATALAALDAQVEIIGATGAVRQIALEALHRLPGDRPDVETTLEPGDLITRFIVPPGPWHRRSRYVKVRDRASYDFAQASAAVALDLDENGAVRAARIGLGGVATKPWRSKPAEAALLGRPVDEEAAQAAAKAAFADAVTHGGNDFKPTLGRRTLIRALLEAATMEVPDARS